MERETLEMRGGSVLEAAELDRVELLAPARPNVKPRTVKLNPSAVTPFPVDPYAPLFAASIVAVLCALWIFSAARDGSWRQVPYWDMAWFHSQALTVLEQLKSAGLSGVYDSWVNHSGTHTPLVPTASAFLMWIFGPTRAAAELVLPISSFLLLISTFRIAERLFGRATGYAASALVAAFPLVLTYGRYYFYEETLAACFAATCWAALASEGFTKWKPTLAFGVMAGLTALSRAAGFVFLTGLVLTVWSFEIRRPRLGTRFLGFALASSVGVAIAGSWYFPNFHKIFGYLTSVTYGPDARMYSGGSKALSVDNLLYYCEWLVLDGPGVPMAAIALLGFGAYAVHARGRKLLSSPILWIVSVFTIDFLICVAGAQRMGGKMMLSLMPLVAILVVRGVVNIPWPRARYVAGAAVALLALHHWIACTFLFPIDKNVPGVKYQASTPGMYVHELANHHNFFLDWAREGGSSALDDYRMSAAFDRLEKMQLTPGSSVGFLGEHVFVSASTLQLECNRRQQHFGFWEPIGLRSKSQADWKDRHLALLLQTSAVILRTNSVDDAVCKEYAALFQELNERPGVQFRQMGEPLTVGDGSQLWFYRRPPRLDPAMAQFVSKN